MNTDTFRRRAFQLILFLAAFGAFALNVERARDLGVFGNAPVWVLNAVPAALTHMYLSWLPRYTISAEISKIYYPAPRGPPASADSVNSIIAKISAMNFGDRSPRYELLGNDDKGMVDFVELAFRLFGIKIQAVATLYYCLLFFSSLIFFLAYRENPPALAALACVLFASYQMLPYTVFNPQLNSPLALRCIPTLSLVACLHCVAFCFLNEVRLGAIVGLVSQVLLIILTIHMRSTAVWQIFAVLAAGGVAALLRWRTESSILPRTTLKAFASVLLPISMLVAGMLALNVYRIIVFPTEYRNGDQIMTRVFWHNVYSGFALHPDLAESHALRIDDVSVVEDIGRFVKNHGYDELWKQIGGESTNFSDLKWAAYDQIVFEAAVEICSAKPAHCLETFIVFKPYYFFDTLLWFYRLREMPSVMDAFTSQHYGDIVKTQVEEATEKLKQQHITGAPWGSGFPLCLFMLSVALSISPLRAKKRERTSVFASVSLMAAASVVPSFVGYPVPHGMVDSVVAINTLLQFSAVLVGSFLISLASGSVRGLLAISDTTERRQR